MSILSLQTAFSTFKNDGFTIEILTFLKNQSFVLEDRFGSVLALFRASFGCSWGYFWGFLGFLDRLNRVSRFALELSWASFALFLLLTMAWGAPMSFFISSRCLLGSILSSQTDAPTLEHVDFTVGILTFLKISRFSIQRWF